MPAPPPHGRRRAAPTPDAPAQPALFELTAAGSPALPAPAGRDESVEAAPSSDEAVELARQLGPGIRLGTSSWHFPGWAGLVWARAHAESALSRHGLAAYARHPLLRCVSLDRSFYRPLDTSTYASLAVQVPADFRFVVKAPAVVTDASRREAGSARVTGDNPRFLDPETVVELAWRPARHGLGERLGALVLQLSPLPRSWLQRRDVLLDRLDSALAALAAARDADACLESRGPRIDGLPAAAAPRAEAAPRPAIAVEVRDPALLAPDVAAVLKARGARYVLGLHDRLPPVAAQLPMLRALWPGPLVVRWNLQRGLRYDAAKDLFSPFDRLAAPDPATRHELARLVVRTAEAGHEVLVTINNKAEGSAPLSVLELARAIARQGRASA